MAVKGRGYMRRKRGGDHIPVSQAPEAKRTTDSLRLGVVVDAVRCARLGVFILFVAVVACLTTGGGRVCLAGMDVMTNAELSDVQGGDVRIDISNPGYYGTGDGTTVVRFAADIYTEVYAQIGAIRLGHYDRYATGSDMGPMGVLHSTDIVQFINPRSSPRTDWGQTHIVNDTVPANFGLPTGPEWSQWDVVMENVQMGTATAPVRMYGLVLRAEFSNWGTQNQELDRIVLGTNQIYGYTGLRGLVTSGYISFNLAHLTQAFGELIATPRMFQLTRDPLTDYHWRMSSLHADPIGDNTAPGTRELWFNTQMNSASINKISMNGPYGAGYFDRTIEDHGAFLSLDFTTGQFRGWNLLAGVNEYEEWVNFGAARTSSGIIRREEGTYNTGEGDY